MGGHGGLNILPQKRWNVYNQDNREKVERDIKKHEEKERQERIRQEQDQADVRYEILKTRKQQRAREENGDDEEKPKSYLNEELKALMPEHFNLFKREEDAHRKEVRQQKNEEYEREKKMKEDRFVEQTTCYLGQTAKKSVPWYCQTGPTEESIEKQKDENRWGRPRGRDRKRDDRRQKGNNQQPSSVFKVPEDNYFQVLDLDSIKEKKVSSKPEVKEEKNKETKERENSVEKDKKAREKSRDKEKKKKDKKDKKEKKDKKDKKHKKHKKQKSERKMSAESSVSRSRSRSRSQSQETGKDKEREEERLKQEKLAKLRAERLKREQAEKKKAEKLIKETFPLGKDSNVDSYYYFN